MSPPAWPPLQYRIEHRWDDEAALIVAFADGDLGLGSSLAIQVARHLRAQARGALVEIDQETKEIVSVQTLPAV